MTYAQVNYKDELGNGKYTIAQAGCFVVAFSNLLSSKFGIDEDPAALNAFFKQQGLYLKDPDGANEDLAWGSVTSFNSQVHVCATGENWPTSDNSIAKFVYGNGITHFCTVASASSKTIVDSYDGQIKPSPYGDPVSFATYEFSAPHPVVAYVAPVSAADTGFHPWVGKVVATATAQVRAEANSSSQGNLGNINADGLLHVGNAFDVIGWQRGQDPYNDGRNIWVKTVRNHWVWAYNTNFFTLPGHGAGESMPVSSNNITYTRFSDSLVVKTTSAAPLINFLTMDQVNMLAMGQVLTVVGRATRNDDPNKTTYFMTEEWFGQADATGQPTSPTGVSTDFLAMASTDVPEKIKVNVIPPDPNKFKETFQSFLGPLDFKALGSVVVKDLEGIQKDVTLQIDNTVKIAGKFIKNGQEYYRTVASVKNGTWYGIPVDLVEKMTAEADEDINSLGRSIINDAKNAVKQNKLKQRAIADVATIEGRFARLINFLRARKAKV